MFFSIWISQGWVNELSALTHPVLSYMIVYGIAIIPGFMNCFLAVSLLLDKRPERKQLSLNQYPPITIIIAAYNEEDSIEDTIRSIKLGLYPNKKEIIIVDDGSTDKTVSVVKRLQDEFSNIKLLENRINRGKSYVLNQGLAEVTTPLFITIDADCYVYKDAITRIVERFYSDPKNTVAVGGAVLIRNSRENTTTKAQEWDYFLGIASVKRLQSMYHGVMVAHGAFSLYVTDVVKQEGGWKDVVGEDIVLTWAFHKKKYRIGFAEDAIIFTDAPNTWRQFFRQRQRWSRGMIEAFKLHHRILFTPRYSSLFAWWNVFFPLIDVSYTFAFIPGIVLALFGYYWIAGPLTLLLLPMLMLLNYVMYKKQIKMFREQGLVVRKNIIGFVLYSVFYTIILQPACVIGYIKEFLMREKKWQTK